MSPTHQHPCVLAFSSKLYFKHPDKADLGTYSVSVSDTDGVSSSFVLDEKGNTRRTQAGLSGFITLSDGDTKMEETCLLRKWCVFVGGWGTLQTSPTLL